MPIVSSVATNAPQTVAVSFTLAAPPPPPPPPPQTGPGIKIVAGGNFGACGTEMSLRSEEAVAAANPDYVFVMGDQALPRNGAKVTTLRDYQDCYDPVWGRFKNITYAAIGVHETDGDTTSPTAGYANGADAYFGAAHVGPPGKNYYSFDLGAWHIIVLNIQSGGPLRPRNIQYRAGSEQLNWLINDLRTHTNKCTLAFWYDQMWISSNDPPTATDPNPNHDYRNQPVRGIWTALYEGGADLVLNGRQHIYERFAPMRYAEGYQHPTASEYAADSLRGIRQISSGLVGDGPVNTPSFLGTHPLSQYRSGGNGMVQVTLGDGVYSWKFLNSRYSSIPDSGSGVCH